MASREVMFVRLCTNRELEDSHNDTKREKKKQMQCGIAWITVVLTFLGDFFLFILFLLSRCNKNDEQYWAAVYAKRHFFILSFFPFLFEHIARMIGKHYALMYIINGASKSSEFCCLIRFPNCILCFDGKCIQRRQQYISGCHIGCNARDNHSMYRQAKNSVPEQLRFIKKIMSIEKKKRKKREAIASI